MAAMTRAIESMAHRAVFSDVSRKLTAVCGRIWPRGQSGLVWGFFGHVVSSRTFFHLSADSEHTRQIKISHLICADEWFLLGSLGVTQPRVKCSVTGTAASLRSSSITTSFPPLVTRWPMLHLTSHHARAPNTLRLLLAFLCTPLKPVLQHWLLHLI